MSTVTDEQHDIARQYVSDYWSDTVDAIGFERAIADPFTPDDNDRDPENWGDDLDPIAGIPLRVSLRIDDTMLAAMVVAHANYERKWRSQGADPDGLNARYEEAWIQHVEPLHGAYTRGPLYGVASCQGGDEIDMLFLHPIHGVDEKMSAEEYRLRTSPYVAAFGVELYPGDRAAGLVLDATSGSVS